MLSLTTLLMCPAAVAAHADQSTALLRVTIDDASAGAVSIEITSDRDPARRWSSRAAVGAPADVSGLPPGTYHLTATTAAGTGAAADVTVAPAEVVLLALTAGPGGAVQLTMADRAPLSQGTRLDDRQLRELPTGSGLWGVLDAAAPFVITDRIDTGGLALGTAARVGNRGASWKRSTVRLGGLDLARGLAGPDDVVWLADLRFVDAVHVASGAATPDVATPGAAVTLVPRRPGPARHRALDVSFTAPGMAAANGSAGAPSISRATSFAHVGAELARPVGSRASVFLAGSASVLRERERGAAAILSSNAATAFAHAIGNVADRTQVRLLGTMQRLGRPSDLVARRSRELRERDLFLHTQAAWEHLTRFGARLEVSAGYQHGRFTRTAGALSPLMFDRATDGPVPNPVTSPNTSRSEARVLLAAPETHGHSVEVGLTLARSASSFRAGPLLPVAELVDGAPARVWLASDPGVASRRRIVHAAGYLNDRLQAARNLTLTLGVRVGLSNGSVGGVQARLAWRVVLPRLAVRWTTRRATVFASYGRYQDELPLDVLGFGDPGEPVRDVHRWADGNANGTYEAEELGTLVARAGRGPGVASIDPDLRAPHTDEVTFGAERAFGSRIRLSATGIVRRERSLLRSVNVGVPASSYMVRDIPDQGEDWDSPADDRTLAVYDRLPSSFGQDRFLLTNPPGDRASYDGLELFWRFDTARWWSFAGASAYRAEASGGNRGFRSTENDQAVIGELLENPNANSYARGRLFFDRAYVLKWATGYRAPRDVTVAVAARYQDGQPFSRLVVVPDLAQGPEIVSAYYNGRTRFTFTTTVDARVEKQLTIGHRRAAIRLDLYNLTNLGLEVEENVVTGPAFRRTTAVQPPLTMRLGFRIEF